MPKKRAPKKSKAPYRACGAYIGVDKNGKTISCTRQKGHSMWSGHSPNRRS